MTGSARNDHTRLVSRRTTLVTAAWAAPAVTVATAAPAWAGGSGVTLTRTTPPTPEFSEDLSVSRTVAVTLRNGSAPSPGQTVLFSLSDTSWLRFPGGATSGSAVTDGEGLASTVLEAAPGAAPTPGEQVTLTASYEGLMVVWTITYRPVTLLSSGSAAGHVLAAALGKAYAWGNGTFGQLGTGVTGVSSNLPVPVDDTGVLAGKTISALALGSGNSLALTADGLLFSWGSDDSGELGNGAGGSSNVPVAVTMSGVLQGRTITQIAAGTDHCLALDSEGRVYAWGRGDSGQLGNGLVTNSQVPVAVSTTGVLNGVRIVAIEAGRDHSLALGDDGNVYGWGGNGSGQLAQPDPPVVAGMFTTPVPVGNLPSSSFSDKAITRIAVGDLHNLALASDGTVHAWGFNGAGRLGDGTTTNRDMPVEVDRTGVLAGKTITAISGGGNFSMALDQAGAVYTWGQGTNGELGNGSMTSSAVPVAVTVAGTALQGLTVTGISAGNTSAYATTSTGPQVSWGSGGSGRLGNGTNTTTALATAVKDLP